MWPATRLHAHVRYKDSLQSSSVVLLGFKVEDFRVWGYMGIMEEKMETIGILQGLYRDIKAILGLYQDNGKENGKYYNDCRVWNG